MSLETPTWDKIIGGLGSTTSEFGGNWGNLVSDYFNGVNIGLTDASKIPIIGTLTRYKFEKLGVFDTDQSHHIVFSADDIDTGPVRKIRFRRMNTPFEEDFAVLENMPQTLLNKNIDLSLNTISNIANANIKAAAAIAYSKLNLTGSLLDADINSSAAISWSKISKTGSILDDIADVVITTPAQYNIIMRNGSSQWVNLAKGSNSTALTVDSSGVLAYTTITNAMLAGSIAYSKLTLSNSIVNADIGTGAAIAYSKLNLATSIINADINGSAAIATTKLADSTNFILKTLDNSFGAHYQDFTKMTVPSNPGANDIRLYVDTADTHLKIKNNTGTVVDLHTVGGGGGATNLDGLTDVDLTTTSPVNGDVLTYTTTGTKWIPAAPPGGGGTVTASSVTTFTNKTIDADGTGNSITNIENADIKAAAAIAYSKLNLATSILNADISGSAAIVTTKLADSANFILKTLDNSFGAHYFDITRMTAPGNPAANDGRFYAKQIDANNDGLFCKIKKAGGFVEVQIA